MKRLLLSALAISTLLAACDSKSKTDAASDASLQDATRQELEVAVADRDSLLSLVNDISTGMEQIKSLENILNTTAATHETADQRARIRADIAAIQQTLLQRREALAALEAKLEKSNLNNAALRQTIETLRAQIDAQQADIESLRAQLEGANATIGVMTERVDSLAGRVDTVTQERNAAQERSTALADELNTCFYVYASSKELKEHKILEGGFLRKTRLMQGDFDESFFTRADKRTLNTINLHSKKAKVLSNMPAGSYEIVDVNGQKVLRILNPDRFWSLSNFLVVEI